MTVAEFFIKLGLKGDVDTGKKLKGIDGTMKDVGASSLAAKAAIVGALYALERFMATGAQRGMDLKQFADYTGKSSEMLQRWQFVLRQTGVTNEETEASFRGLYNMIGQIGLNQPLPAGLSIFAQKTHFDRRQKDDVNYWLKKLQEFVKLGTSPEIAQVAKTLGLGENMIGGLRTAKTRPEDVPMNQIIGDAQRDKLAKIHVQWMQLFSDFDLFRADLTAKNGGGLLKNITDITHSIEGLIKALVLFSEKVKVFQALNSALQGISSSIKEITGWASGSRSFWGEELDKSGNRKGGRSVTGALLGSWIDPLLDLYNTPTNTKDSDQIEKMLSNIKPIFETNKPIAPTITVHQNITHNGDAKDTKAVRDTHKTSILHAAKQLNQLQVN